MDLRLLRTFLAVAETGSFTAAAQSLNCVQSNITSQIRKLEEEFGERLFHRGKGGARLTWFGQLMRKRAKEIVRLVRETEAELQEAAGAAAPLALGALETVAATRLPGLLVHLRQACPEAQISLKTGPTSRLLSKLWRRDIDAAFVAGEIDEDRFRSIVAFREVLVCVSVDPGAPSGPLLAFPSGCSYRAAAEGWLNKNGQEPVRVIDLGSLDGILGCVEAGLGIAVVPKSAVGTYHGHEALHLTPLPDPYGQIEIRFCWRHDHALVSAHRVLLEQLSGRDQKAQP